MENYKFILYLDLDGVLTSEDYIIYIHNSFVKNENDENNKTNLHYRNFMQQYCFSKKAVDFLNKLYDNIPYCIILTSTRRFEFTSTEWNLIFKLNGIKAYVGGRTNKLKEYKHDKYNWRAEEIEDYHFKGKGMFTFKNIPFLIIDDDNFDLLEYEDKLIHVNPKTGVTLDYYNEVLEKLKVQGVK